MQVQAALSHDEAIALERSYWDALVRKDGKRASALSGDPCLVTGAQGLRSIARDELEKMTEAEGWSLQSYAFEDVRVLAPAPDIAIVAYTVTQQVTMNGASRSFRAADMSTWVREPAGWVCHAHAESLLDAEA